MTDEQRPDEEDTDEQRRLEIPDRRKNTYVKLEEHVDERLEIDRNYIHRWVRRGIIAFSIIGVACTVALIGFGIVLHEIQQTRTDFVRSNCESQNKQHDDTYSALKAVAQRDIDRAREAGVTGPGAVSPEEIESRRDATLILIDSLRPKQDCDYLVKLSQGDATPTPVPTLPPLPPTPSPSPTP